MTAWLLPAAVCCALAGIADSVSAVFRTTILQASTPDHLRGRLQGVFVVVVAGGPRIGDLLAGGGTKLLNEGMGPAARRRAVRCRGLDRGPCAVGRPAAPGARAQSGFLRYDARNPVP